MSTFAWLSIGVGMLAILGITAWLHAFMASAGGNWGSVGDVAELGFDAATRLPESSADAARQSTPFANPVRQHHHSDAIFGDGARADLAWLGNHHSHAPGNHPQKHR